MKPQPVAKETICSLCGLDWKLHAKTNPTPEGCVKLLRAELAKRPLYANWNPQWSTTGVTLC